MPEAATIGSAFNAIRTVRDVANNINHVDAASSNPSQFMAIQAPASRPPPPHTDIRRSHSGYAITPQALATNLAQVPAAQRTGPWYVVATGRYPGIYKNS